MFFTEPALLNRQLLSDLPRPLAGLSFRLGVAAGLASVAVVDDDDFQALRTADTSHESHTPRRSLHECECEECEVCEVCECDDCFHTDFFLNP